MVLLILVSIVYIPIVLPWLLPGISVNAIEIGRSLVVLILLPLAIARFIDSRYPELAESLEGIMAQASNTSLIVLFVLLLVLHFPTLIGTIGTGAIFTTILFVVLSFVIGYFLSPYPEARSVLGLGTAQRNIAAALVVATGNFGDDPNVLTMIVIGSLLMMVILFPVAGELGRRNRRSEFPQN